MPDDDFYPTLVYLSKRRPPLQIVREFFDDFSLSDFRPTRIHIPTYKVLQSLFVESLKESRSIDSPVLISNVTSKWIDHSVNDNNRTIDQFGYRAFYILEDLAKSGRVRLLLASKAESINEFCFKDKYGNIYSKVQLIPPVRIPMLSKGELLEIFFSNSRKGIKPSPFSIKQLKGRIRYRKRRLESSIQTRQRQKSRLEKELLNFEIELLLAQFARDNSLLTDNDVFTERETEEELKIKDGIDELVITL